MRKNGFSPVLIVIALAFLAILGMVLFRQIPRKGSEKEVASGGNLLALGASFTKANNLSSKLVGDNPEYSFATGTKIESIYQYLKTKGEELSPKNLAESGANSQKVLSQQIPNAISYHPKYVTIDIMADIFEEEKPIKFRQNLAEIAKQIKNQDNTVLVGTYPNISALRKASYPACSEDKLGIGVNKVTEEKIKLFNQTIKDVAREFNLVLVDNFDTLGPSDVSDYDCLHPNIEGQEKLAKSWIEAFEKGR